MKDKLLALYVLTLLMFSPIISAFLFVSGQSAAQGQVQSMIFALTIVGWLFFIVGRFLSVGGGQFAFFRKYIGIFAIFAIFYLATRFVYTYSGVLSVLLNDTTPEEATTRNLTFFLRWASLSVTSFFIGAILVQKENVEKVSKLIPYFTIPLTVIIALATFNSGSFYFGQDENYGFTYQNISYYHASFMLYNSFYVFFYKSESRSDKVLRLLSFICLLLNIVYAFSAGGRGAAVLLAAASVYIIWYKMFKNGGNLIIKAFLVLSIGGALGIIASKMGVFESEGFYRVSHMIEIDAGGRSNLSDLAFQVIEDNYYMGSGLGSVWFTVGYPSHNIFQDLILELGIAGLVVFLVLIFKTYKILLKCAAIDSKYQFIIINSFNIVILLFSTYWISSQILWMTWGCSAAIAYSKKYHLEEL